MIKKRLQRLIVPCILVFSICVFTPSDISLSHALQKTSQQAMERARKKAFEQWKKKKRAMERAKKKTRIRWKKGKGARKRAKEKKLKQWKKLRKAEELTRAMELARLQKQKLELKKHNLKLEEQKLKLQERKLKEEERAGLEKARQEKKEQEIEKRKIALAERQQRAKELATTRELARLEREKEEIEKRKIALAEREQRTEERAEAMELARLEKQNLKLEEEKLNLEKQKIKAKREKQEIEKRKIALAERQQRAEELATTRELARLEREKIREKREKRESERRRIALLEKQKRDEERAKARELARLEKEKLKEERRKVRPGELVEKLLEKHTLTLDECIDVAMETHIQLKVAKKQLKLARFRLFEAKRNLGPTVTAKWEESKGRVSDRLYTGRKFIVEGRQPIFYGGELVFSVRQARVNLEIVESDYDRIKNDLILQVKKAYYTLDKAKKALGIQKKLQDRTKTLFDMVKAGYEAAVIPQIEFLKISSQYNQTSFQVISAREDISVARLLLQQAMGTEEEIEIVGIKEPEIIKLDLEDCFNLASLNRPEIKISQLSLEYFRYEKKIMQARANWPRVDFLGSYGNTQEDFVAEDNIGSDGVNLIDPRGLGPEYYFGTKISLPIWGSTFGYSYTEEEWQPVVQTTKGTKAKTHTMTFSLFDKLGDISGVKEADVEYMSSLDGINKKKQEITLEVKETFFKYRKAILLMDIAKSKIEFQTKQVEILEIRRELGEALYSDVVEELIKLAEEEFSYTQAISDYYISIALLNKAIGIDGYFEV